MSFLNFGGNGGSLNEYAGMQGKGVQDAMATASNHFAIQNRYADTLTAHQDTLSKIYDVNTFAPGDDAVEQAQIMAAGAPVYAETVSEYYRNLGTIASAQQKVGEATLKHQFQGVEAGFKDIMAQHQTAQTMLAHGTSLLGAQRKTMGLANVSQYQTNRYSNRARSAGYM